MQAFDRQTDSGNMAFHATWKKAYSALQTSYCYNYCLVYDRLQDLKASSL